MSKRSDIALVMAQRALNLFHAIDVLGGAGRFVGHWQGLAVVMRGASLGERFFFACQFIGKDALPSAIAGALRFAIDRRAWVIVYRTANGNRSRLGIARVLALRATTGRIAGRNLRERPVQVHPLRAFPRLVGVFNRTGGRINILINLRASPIELGAEDDGC